jgi:fucose permease
MLGLAYGLLDVLNAKFQIDLNITAAKAGGLHGAYSGAYFIGPLTYSGWIVRKFRYNFSLRTHSFRFQILTVSKIPLDIHHRTLHLWR